MDDLESWDDSRPWDGPLNVRVRPSSFKHSMTTGSLPGQTHARQPKRCSALATPDNTQIYEGGSSKRQQPHWPGALDLRPTLPADQRR